MATIILLAVARFCSSATVYLQMCFASSSFPYAGDPFEELG